MKKQTFFRAKLFSLVIMGFMICSDTLPRNKSMSIFSGKSKPVELQEKSNIAAETKLDSIYTYSITSGGDSALSERTVYYYNELGQNIMELSSLWKKDWFPVKKMLNAYNEQGYLSLAVLYEKDLSYNEWENTSRDEYTYHDNGNISGKVTYSFYYLRGDKRVSLFDSAGRVISDAQYSMEKQDESDTLYSLTGIFRTDYMYDEWGHASDITDFVWDTLRNDWTGKRRSQTIYQDRHLLQSGISYLFNAVSNTWDPDHRTDYLYNYLGLDSITSYSYFNSSDSSWICSHRTVTTYDTVQHTSLGYRLSFDSATSQWDSAGKIITVYQSPDWTNYSEMSQIRDTTNNRWINTSKKQIRKIIYDDGGYWRSRFLWDWDDITGQWLTCCGGVHAFNGNGKATCWIPYSSNSSRDLFYPNFKDTMKYRNDGSLLLKISYSHWDLTNGVWTEGTRTDMHYNPYDQPDLITVSALSVPDIWNEVTRQRYYYGDFVLPDTGTYLTDEGTLYAALETADSCQWYNCETGKDVQGAVLRTFRPSVPGSYAVRITTGNYIVSSGCRDTRTLSAQNPNAVSFRCYPNPAGGQVHLVIPAPATREIVLRVTGLSGHTLRTFHYPGSQGTNITLNLSGLPEGMYLLHIYKDGKPTGVQKIILK